MKISSVLRFRKGFRLFTFLAGGFGLISCEKEIDVDLNASDSKYVIEGIIREDSANQYVRITKTVNFSEKSIYPGVSNAAVTISDDAGNMIQLAEIESGLYKATGLAGVPGRKYTLTVSTEGKVFTSESTMPLKIQLDSISTQKSTFGPPGENNDSLYVVFPKFMDSPIPGNAWWFVMETQRERDLDLQVYNDNIGNGTEYIRPIISRDFAVKLGDSLTLEMRNIDTGTYTYFFSLNQNSGNANGPGGGATPANPVSNISGGCLGYFAAFTVQKMVKVVR